MLSFNQPAVYQSSNCYVTYGILPHLDPKQLPSKSKPWTTLTSQDFVHKADLIIPQEMLELVQEKLLGDKLAPTFKRVVISLHDILSGEFFTEYIKKGDVLMLSEGRRGIDNVLSLRGGTLTMFLGKEAYERAGLVGKPHGVKGKRGLKPRWIVEFDLTSPSMFPGKKGFDRLIYASNNAFAEPITWLFCNVSSTTPDPDPLSRHFATNYTANPGLSQGIDAVIPKLSPDVDFIASSGKEDFEDFSTNLYEWLSLVRLQSPRIQVGDKIDPYLSRYQVPDSDTEGKICKISWQGFLAPSWCRQILIGVITALPSKTWFSFSTTTFSKGLAGDNAECTILRPPNSSGEYLMWEVKGHE
ncbi:ribonuclease P 40kDa subunit-domain-containing protein [Chaetomidium leptoderma]|uniref:Ribonuclease P 40kDa subunit-domain-containing protein n=1 Tax=Chaetomidium leptoderma TaxID=669021 RepID=A0AAN6VPH4_9PEZI|nr:ribonuclease P 40kDa subunit-domain-containing protein [Chaetomidium leptoderma]